MKKLTFVFALAAFVFGTAPTASAVGPYDLDFAAPAPVSCPDQAPACADGPPPFPDVFGVDFGMSPVGSFLTYPTGSGDTFLAAAWATFDGNFDETTFSFGTLIQDIDTVDGGLGVNEGTDNIDPNESVALFANFNPQTMLSDPFTVTDVSLLNHPFDPVNPNAIFQLWYTDNPDLFQDWSYIYTTIGNAGPAALGLGEIFGIAFEARDGINGTNNDVAYDTFYVSAISGEVIPEPGTVLLLGLGRAGLALRQRRA